MFSAVGTDNRKGRSLFINLHVTLTKTRNSFH